jgi:hypothetical protein
MRSLAIATLAASSLFALTPAQAQQGQTAPGSIYAGVSLSQVSYEEEGRGTAKPTMISGTLGKVINQNFAVEGRLGTGLTDNNVANGASDVAVDFFLGAYAKGILPLTPHRPVWHRRRTYGDLPRQRWPARASAPTRISLRHRCGLRHRRDHLDVH